MVKRKQQLWATVNCDYELKVCKSTKREKWSSLLVTGKSKIDKMKCYELKSPSLNDASL